MGQHIACCTISADEANANDLLTVEAHQNLSIIDNQKDAGAEIVKYLQRNIIDGHLTLGSEQTIEHLSPLDVEYIATAVQTLPDITHLTIKDLQGVDFLLKELWKLKLELQALENLKRIRLLGEDVNDKMVEIVMRMCGPHRINEQMGGSNGSVDSLIISNNRRNEVTDSALTHIARNLPKSVLTTLVIFGTNIGDIGAQALAYSLKSSRTLSRLVLYGKNITKNTIRDFTTIIGKSDQDLQLQELVIGGTRFGDSGSFNRFLKALWGLKKLRRLGIFNVLLRDPTLVEIIRLINATQHAPDELLLAYSGSDHFLPTALELWSQGFVKKLSICALEAGHEQFQTIHDIVVKNYTKSTSLELVCGKAPSDAVEVLLKDFKENGGCKIIEKDGALCDKADSTGAPYGIFISQDVEYYLEKKLYRRIFLRDEDYNNVPPPSRNDSSEA